MMESHINLDWQCGLLHHKICQTVDFANDFRVQVAICGTGGRGKLTLYCKLEVDYDYVCLWLGKCEDLDDSFESIHNSFESIPNVLLELKSNINIFADDTKMTNKVDTAEDEEIDNGSLEALQNWSVTSNSSILSI